MLTTYPAGSLATMQANGLPLVTAAPVVATAPATGSSVPADVTSTLVNTTPASAAAGLNRASLLAAAAAIAALAL